MSFIEQKPLHEFTEKAYLDYSMYVILDRALPHLADGLKPVQRRIIYAMSELGLKHTAKYKKSARTVGDVLGKFHPHGDSACYEAMVLMAQNFSYRYPLVDGQGNWGSTDDPKSFAAMRYTEARMSAYANALLSELEEGTVEWSPNFDGTLEEPELLPAQVPNVLLNGSTGIAVGMATDIPPHNLTEIVNACIAIIDKPALSLSELMEIVQGPDYPTDAEIITPKADLLAMYEKGHGSIRMRGIFTQEDGDSVVITALPHQVSPAKIAEQIAAQMQQKKLPMLVDLRDESDHENPTRLVLILRSNRVDVDGLMSHLFATTDLERTYRVNMNMIGLSGRPEVKPLLSLLKEWLRFRQETTRRRLSYRLEKILARLHLLDGFLIAFLNIDEVIAIIREFDDPKAKLIARFKLSDRQAEAILEIKLRHLAKLEEIRIRTEQSELSAERETLEQLLGSDQRLKTLLKKELKGMIELYGDARRSPIVSREQSQSMSKTQLLPSEPVTVILSEKGWIRAAKGHEMDGASLTYKAGDGFLASCKGRTTQQAIFVDSTGRSYSLPAHELPSARGQGEPLTGHVNLPSGAHTVGLLMGDDAEQVLWMSDVGYGFICPLSELYCKNRTGKQVLKVGEGSQAMVPLNLGATLTGYIAMLSLQGKLLLVDVATIDQMARGKGCRLMHLDKAAVESGLDKILAIAHIEPNQALYLTGVKKPIRLTPADWKAYVAEKGRRGGKLPGSAQKATGLAKDL